MPSCKKKRAFSTKLLYRYTYVQESMFHHKSVKRAFRRCTAMIKIAAFIMTLMFVSAFLHVSFDDAELEENVRDYEESVADLVLRNERSVDAVRITSDRRLALSSNDITIERVTARHQAPTPAKVFSPKKKNEARKTEFDGVKLELANQIRPEPLKMTVGYDAMLSKKFKDREQKIQKAWRNKIKSKIFDKTPPNPSFIFHNKLPKSGSSTMNNILKKLSKENNFNFFKMETTDVHTSDDGYLIKELESIIKKPYLLLKHHRWLNFTNSNQPQPTYINVMRDPLEWFTSRYYFSRYGWERKPGCRKQDCGMSKDDRKMEIDECVKKRHRECLNPWMYVQFFCGMGPECYNVTTLAQKEKATEIAKSNILNEYYAVGILEQFQDTLDLFEVMMPKYFKNAVPIWKSDFVQEKQRLTRTTYKKEMSEESKNFFRNGPLHYEIELYDFARELFNRKLKHFHVKSDTVTS